MKTVNTLALLMGLSVAGLVEAGGHIMVSDAWVREAPPGAMSQAGYMTLHNHSGQKRVLVGAESSAFGKVMLHQTVMDGAMAKMVHQHMIVIPAKGMVSFEPNSYHLMMMRPKQALKVGDTVSVTLRFKNGEAQEVNHEVRAVMGAMDHGSHHQDH